MTTTEVIKLLAIDDKPDNLISLGAMVRDALPQTIVLTATDGLAGFALAAAEDPDVILLGIDMSGMDGFEVCRRLKADARLRLIPVVFVTDFKTDAASRVKALEVGAEGFMSHPIDSAELTAQLRAMVKIKAANRSQQIEKAQLEALVAERTQALHASDERFRVAQEMSPDGFTILHPLRSGNGEIVDFTWVYENQAVARINGTNSEEVKGKRLLDLFPTHAETALWEAYTSAADTGKPQIIEEVYVGEIVSRPTWLRLVVVSIGEDIAILAENISERKQAEAELQESENRFSTIYFTNPLSQSILSQSTGLVIEANDACCDLYGYSRAELLGADPDQLDLWANPAETPRILGELQRTGHVLPTEVTIRKKSGEIRTVLFSVEPISWKGTPSLLTSSIDITARKQAEQALQESESRLRAIGDNLPAANIYQLRIESNGAARFTYLSAGVEQLHECTVEEALGDSSLVFNRIHPEDVPGWMVFTEKSARELSVFDHELRICRKSGEIRWHRLVSKPRRTADGATLFDGVDIDVTKRKRAEEEQERLSAEVRAQARQMAQILAAVPAGVLLLDVVGQVLRANSVAERDLAALAGAAVGDTLTHLGERPLAELLTSPPTRGVWHAVKSAGRTFEVIARPVENDAEPALWVLVINDVTREREIQAQLQQQAQLAVVGQLAAGIAHDFNNIMAVIVLYTQMGLSMAGVPPQLRERLEIILQQANRATDLIQQILDFSRRAVLERRPLNLLLFLKEIVKLLEHTLPENISIELAYVQDNYTVGVDPTRIQQAIMNLATNARDAMLPQGGGELRIALSRTAATDEIRCVTCGQVTGGEWVRIAVTDSGCGIPPAALSHIFEPFFTTKEVGKGTGLGLAQVYGIVKQHEGHIDVVTEVGRGTTFHLYLPALSVQPPEAPAHEREAAIKGQGEMVLLVEDNVVLREALAAILEVLNYRTLQAASGSEALAVLEQHASEIALVLSDLVMPEMGGQALLHAMRQRGLTVPMVILSGHPLESELEALKALGLAGWMLKPPSVKPLSHLLAQVLHRESAPG